MYVMKALIISDKRLGHESQSVALCKLKNFDYEIINVKFKFKILKLFSYVLDFLKIYIPIFMYEKPKNDKFDFIVSAGSTTYYANKFFARKFKSKNIALMMPKGFRKDFYHIFSTKNDTKIKLENMTVLPININFLEKKEFYSPKAKSISFIIGGNNKIFEITPNILDTIDEIMVKFKGYEVLLTTSPRTPKWLEEELKKRNFNFSIIFSENKINPIYDFVTKSEFVFITRDSVSMISEAVCAGKSSVYVLPLKKNKNSKFDKFLLNLEELNLVKIYSPNDTFEKTEKLNLKDALKGTIL